MIFGLKTTGVDSWVDSCLGGRLMGRLTGCAKSVPVRNFSVPVISCAMSRLMGRLMSFNHAYLSKYKSKINKIFTIGSQIFLFYHLILSNQGFGKIIILPLKSNKTFSSEKYQYPFNCFVIIKINLGSNNLLLFYDDKTFEQKHLYESMIMNFKGMKCIIGSLKINRKFTTNL